MGNLYNAYISSYRMDTPQWGDFLKACGDIYNSPQLKSLEKSVKNSNAVLGVCFQTRYDDSKQKLKEIIRSEDIVAAYVNLVWIRDRACLVQVCLRKSAAS